MLLSIKYTGGILSRGILSWGDFVLGGFCPGGFCLGDFVRGGFVRGDFVLIPSVLHIVQQIKTVCHTASTPNGYDIFHMCVGSRTQVKQKNPVLPFSRRVRHFWQKILVKPVT